MQLDKHRVMQSKYVKLSLSSLFEKPRRESTVCELFSRKKLFFTVQKHLWTLLNIQTKKVRVKASSCANF